VAKLGRDFAHVAALEDEQAREAAAHVAWDRVVGQAGGDRRRLEDPLAPVVPVLARPLAEHEVVVVGAPAADAELGQVAGEEVIALLARLLRRVIAALGVIEAIDASRVDGTMALEQLPQAVP
jgi:hypothetical protein